MRTVLLTLGLALFSSTPAGSTYSIEGVVRSRITAEPQKDVLIVLECTCIAATREVQTDDCGRYSFADLPAGTYTVHAFQGVATLTKVVRLGE